jgi:serine phosphatase RsbU (regulator of sigma subunit)
MIVLIALIARFFVIQRKKNLLLKKQNREISEQKNLIEDNNKQLLRLNEEILQQKEEITVIAENLQSANEEISSKNELIEYKNAKITSSINYAKRIQAALLPSENSLKQILGDFLLFYRPKDIVSGDFYWVKKIESGDKTLTVVVVADCTGHGVPGALISMIGIELLEEIVIHGKIFLPNEILFTLNQKLRNLLRPEETGTQDGMDLIVLTFVKQGEMTEEILFSGAMNPILFKRKNAGIEIIKGDKMPIGGKLNARKNPEFTLHKISYTEGMTFFCMTDGLQDQFGGELKKKLGLQRIIRFFEENADLTFEEQERQLQSFFEKWQGEEEQIDDITLLSFAV